MIGADFAVVILRLVIGLMVAGHGAQKLFGWFSGPGLKGFSGGMKRMGSAPAHVLGHAGRAGRVWGRPAAGAGPADAAGRAGSDGRDVVAIVKVHWPKGFWNGKGGIEFPLALWTPAFAIGLAGPADFSLDRCVGLAGLSADPLCHRPRRC